MTSPSTELPLSGRPLTSQQVLNLLTGREVNESDPREAPGDPDRRIEVAMKLVNDLKRSDSLTTSGGRIGSISPDSQPTLDKPTVDAVVDYLIECGGTPFVRLVIGRLQHHPQLLGVAGQVKDAHSTRRFQAQITVAFGGAAPKKTLGRVL